VSAVIIVADCDEVRCGEGVELRLGGYGLIPYPATPPPRPRPSKEEPRDS
jgi:hypothetical protein